MGVDRKRYASVCVCVECQVCPSSPLRDPSDPPFILPSTSNPVPLVLMEMELLQACAVPSRATESALECLKRPVVARRRAPSHLRAPKVSSRGLLPVPSEPGRRTRVLRVSLGWDCCCSPIHIEVSTGRQSPVLRIKGLVTRLLLSWKAESS